MTHSRSSVGSSPLSSPDPFDPRSVRRVGPARRARLHIGDTKSTIDLADQLITADRAARRLGISARTLRGWRAQGYGPPAIRLGLTGAVLRYRVADLDAWVESARDAQPTTPDAA